jgi:hypothetical protein
MSLSRIYKSASTAAKEAQALAANVNKQQMQITKDTMKLASDTDSKKAAKAAQEKAKQKEDLAADLANAKTKAVTGFIGGTVFSVLGAVASGLNAMAAAEDKNTQRAIDVQNKAKGIEEQADSQINDLNGQIQSIDNALATGKKADGTALSDTEKQQLSATRDELSGRREDLTQVRDAAHNLSEKMETALASGESFTGTLSFGDSQALTDAESDIQAIETQFQGFTSDAGGSDPTAEGGNAPRAADPNSASGRAAASSTSAAAVMEQCGIAASADAPAVGEDGQPVAGASGTDSSPSRVATPSLAQSQAGERGRRQLDNKLSFIGEMLKHYNNGDIEDVIGNAITKGVYKAIQSATSPDSAIHQRVSELLLQMAMDNAAKHKGEVGDAQQQVQDAQTEFDTANTVAGQAQQEVDQLSDQRDNLEADIKTQEQALATAATPEARQAAQQQLTALQGQLTGVNRNLDAAQDKSDRAQIQMNRAQQHLNKAAERLASRQSDLDEALGELQSSLGYLQALYTAKYGSDRPDLGEATGIWGFGDSGLRSRGSQLIDQAMGALQSGNQMSAKTRDMLLGAVGSTHGASGLSADTQTYVEKMLARGDQRRFEAAQEGEEQIKELLADLDDDGQLGGNDSIGAGLGRALLFQGGIFSLPGISDVVGAGAEAVGDAIGDGATWAWDQIAHGGTPDEILQEAAGGSEDRAVQARAVQDARMFLLNHRGQELSETDQATYDKAQRTVEASDRRERRERNPNDTSVDFVDRRTMIQAQLNRYQSTTADLGVRAAASARDFSNSHGGDSIGWRYSDYHEMADEVEQYVRQAAGQDASTITGGTEGDDDHEGQSLDAALAALDQIRTTGDRERRGGGLTVDYSGHLVTAQSAGLDQNTLSLQHIQQQVGDIDRTVGQINGLTIGNESARHQFTDPRFAGLTSKSDELLAEIERVNTKPGGPTAEDRAALETLAQGLITEINAQLESGNLTDAQRKVLEFQKENLKDGNLVFGAQQLNAAAVGEVRNWAGGRFEMHIGPVGLFGGQDAAESPEARQRDEVQTELLSMLHQAEQMTDGLGKEQLVAAIKEQLHNLLSFQRVDMTQISSAAQASAAAHLSANGQGPSGAAATTQDQVNAGVQQAITSVGSATSASLDNLLGVASNPRGMSTSQMTASIEMLNEGIDTLAQLGMLTGEQKQELQAAVAQLKSIVQALRDPSLSAADRSRLNGQLEAIAGAQGSLRGLFAAQTGKGADAAAVGAIASALVANSGGLSGALAMANGAKRNMMDTVAENIGRGGLTSGQIGSMAASFQGTSMQGEFQMAVLDRIGSTSLTAADLDIVFGPGPSAAKTAASSQMQQVEALDRLRRRVGEGAQITANDADLLTAFGGAVPEKVADALGALNGEYLLTSNFRTGSSALLSQIGEQRAALVSAIQQGGAIAVAQGMISHAAEMQLSATTVQQLQSSLGNLQATAQTPAGSAKRAQGYQSLHALLGGDSLTGQTSIDTLVAAGQTSFAKLGGDFMGASGEWAAAMAMAMRNGISFGNASWTDIQAAVRTLQGGGEQGQVMSAIDMLAANGILSADDVQGIRSASGTVDPTRLQAFLSQVHSNPALEAKLDGVLSSQMDLRTQFTFTGLVSGDTARTILGDDALTDIGIVPAGMTPGSVSAALSQFLNGAYDVSDQTGTRQSYMALMTAIQNGDSTGAATAFSNMQTAFSEMRGRAGTLITELQSGNLSESDRTAKREELQRIMSNMTAVQQLLPQVAEAMQGKAGFETLQGKVAVAAGGAMRSALQTSFDGAQRGQDYETYRTAFEAIQSGDFAAATTALQELNGRVGSLTGRLGEVRERLERIRQLKDERSTAGLTPAKVAELQRLEATEQADYTELQQISTQLGQMSQLMHSLGTALEGKVGQTGQAALRALIVDTGADALEGIASVTQSSGDKPGLLATEAGQTMAQRGAGAQRDEDAAAFLGLSHDMQRAVMRFQQSGNWVGAAGAIEHYLGDQEDMLAQASQLFGENDPRVQTLRESLDRLRTALASGDNDAIESAVKDAMRSFRRLDSAVADRFGTETSRHASSTSTSHDAAQETVIVIAEQIRNEMDERLAELAQAGGNDEEDLAALRALIDQAAGLGMIGGAEHDALKTQLDQLDSERGNAAAFQATLGQFATRMHSLEARFEANAMTAATVGLQFEGALMALVGADGRDSRHTALANAEDAIDDMVAAGMIGADKAADLRRTVQALAGGMSGNLASGASPQAIRQALEEAAGTVQTLVSQGLVSPQTGERLTRAVEAAQSAAGSMSESSFAVSAVNDLRKALREAISGDVVGAVREGRGRQLLAGTGADQHSGNMQEAFGRLRQHMLDNARGVIQGLRGDATLTTAEREQLQTAITVMELNGTFTAAEADDLRGDLQAGRTDALLSKLGASGDLGRKVDAAVLDRGADVLARIGSSGQERAYVSQLGEQADALLASLQQHGTDDARRDQLRTIIGQMQELGLITEAKAAQMRQALDLNEFGALRGQMQTILARTGGEQLGGLVQNLGSTDAGVKEQAKTTLTARIDAAVAAGLISAEDAADLRERVAQTTGAPGLAALARDIRAVGGAMDRVDVQFDAARFGGDAETAVRMRELAFRQARAHGEEAVFARYAQMGEGELRQRAGDLRQNVQALLDAGVFSPEFANKLLGDLDAFVAGGAGAPSFRAMRGELGRARDLLAAEREMIDETAGKDRQFLGARLATTVSNQVDRLVAAVTRAQDMNDVGARSQVLREMDRTISRLEALVNTNADPALEAQLQALRGLRTTLADAHVADERQVRIGDSTTALRSIGESARAIRARLSQAYGLTTATTASGDAATRRQQAVNRAWGQVNELLGQKNAGLDGADLVLEGQDLESMLDGLESVGGDRGARIKAAAEALDQATFDLQGALGSGEQQTKVAAYWAAVQEVHDALAELRTETPPVVTPPTTTTTTTTPPSTTTTTPVTVDAGVTTKQLNEQLNVGRELAQATGNETTATTTLNSKVFGGTASTGYLSQFGQTAFSYMLLDGAADGLDLRLDRQGNFASGQGQFLSQLMMDPNAAGLTPAERQQALKERALMLIARGDQTGLTALLNSGELNAETIQSLRTAGLFAKDGRIAADGALKAQGEIIGLAARRYEAMASAARNGTVSASALADPAVRSFLLAKGIINADNAVNRDAARNFVIEHLAPAMQALQTQMATDRRSRSWQTTSGIEGRLRILGHQSGLADRFGGESAINSVSLGGLYRSGRHAIGSTNIGQLTTAVVQARRDVARWKELQRQGVITVSATDTSRNATLQADVTAAVQGKIGGEEGVTAANAAQVADIAQRLMRVNGSLSMDDAIKLAADLADNFAAQHMDATSQAQIIEAIARIGHDLAGMAAGERALAISQKVASYVTEHRAEAEQDLTTSVDAFKAQTLTTLRYQQTQFQSQKTALEQELQQLQQSGGVGSAARIAEITRSLETLNQALGSIETDIAAVEGLTASQVRDRLTELMRGRDPNAGVLDVSSALTSLLPAALMGRITDRQAAIQSEADGYTVMAQVMASSPQGRSILDAAVGNSRALATIMQILQAHHGDWAAAMADLERARFTNAKGESVRAMDWLATTYADRMRTEGHNTELNTSNYGQMTQALAILAGRVSQQFSTIDDARGAGLDQYTGNVAASAGVVHLLSGLTSASVTGSVISLDGLQNLDIGRLTAAGDGLMAARGKGQAFFQDEATRLGGVASRMATDIGSMATSFGQVSRAMGAVTTLDAMSTLATSMHSEGERLKTEAQDDFNDAMDLVGQVEARGYDVGFVHRNIERMAGMMGGNVLNLLQGMQAAFTLMRAPGSSNESVDMSEVQEDGEKNARDAARAALEAELKLAEISERMKEERIEGERRETQAYLDRLGREYEVAALVLMQARRALSLAMSSGDSATIRSAMMALASAAESFRNIKGVVDSMRAQDRQDHGGEQSKEVSQFNERVSHFERDANQILEEVESGALASMVADATSGDQGRMQSARAALGASVGEQITKGMSTGAIIKQVLRVLRGQDGAGGRGKGAAHSEEGVLSSDDVRTLNQFAEGVRQQSTQQGRQRIQEMIDDAGGVGQSGNAGQAAGFAGSLRSLLRDAQTGEAGVNLTSGQRNALGALASLLERNLGEASGDRQGIAMQMASAQMILSDIMGGNGGQLREGTKILTGSEGQTTAVTSETGPQSLQSRSQQASELITRFLADPTNMTAENRFDRARELVHQLDDMFSETELAGAMGSAGALGRISSAAANELYSASSGGASSVESLLGQLRTGLNRTALTAPSQETAPQRMDTRSLSSIASMVHADDTPVTDSHRGQPGSVTSQVVSTSGGTQDLDAVVSMVPVIQQRRSTRDMANVIVANNPLFTQVYNQMESATMARQLYDVAATRFAEKAQAYQNLQADYLTVAEALQAGQHAQGMGPGNLSETDRTALRNMAQTVLGVSGLNLQPAERAALEKISTGTGAIAAGDLAAMNTALQTVLDRQGGRLNSARAEANTASEGMNSELQRWKNADVALQNRLGDLRNAVGSGSLGGERGAPGSFEAALQGYEGVLTDMLAYEQGVGSNDAELARRSQHLLDQEQSNAGRQAGLIGRIDADQALVNQARNVNTTAINGQLDTVHQQQAALAGPLQQATGERDRLQGELAAAEAYRNQLRSVAAAYDQLSQAWTQSGGQLNETVAQRGRELVAALDALGATPPGGAVDGLNGSIERMRLLGEAAGGTGRGAGPEASRTTTVNGLLGRGGDAVGQQLRPQLFGAIGQMDTRMGNLNRDLGNASDRVFDLQRQQSQLVAAERQLAGQLNIVGGSQTGDENKLRDQVTSTSRTLGGVGDLRAETNRVQAPEIVNRSAHRTDAGRVTDDKGTRGQTRREHDLLAERQRAQEFRQRAHETGGASSSAGMNQVRSEWHSDATAIRTAAGRQSAEQRIGTARTRYLAAARRLHDAEAAGANPSEIRQLRQTMEKARAGWQSANGRTARNFIAEMWGGDRGSYALMALKFAMELFMEAKKQEERVRELEGLYAKEEKEMRELAVELALYSRNAGGTAQR